MDSQPSSGFSYSPASKLRNEELQSRKGASPIPSEMKARQVAKIRELTKALQSAGFCTLDEQAKALGLCRSTAWTVRKANHKASGLSVSIINRMLAAPHLPPLVRSKILEYVKEKVAGVYGGSRTQRRSFAARISLGVGLCEKHGNPEIPKGIDPFARFVRLNQSLENQK
jgi:hypothetical protein